MDARRPPVRDDGACGAPFLYILYLPTRSHSIRAFQTGLPPFYDEDVNVMYQRILSDPLLFPQDMPHDAMTLITGLLQRDPAKRLGANGAEEIKRHPFFSKHIDWNRCVSMSISRGMGLLAGWPAAVSCPATRRGGRDDR